MEREKGWLCTSWFKSEKLILVADDSNHARKIYAEHIKTLPLFVSAKRLYEADDMPVFYGARILPVGDVEVAIHNLMDAKRERNRRIAAQLKIDAEAKQKAELEAKKAERKAKREATKQAKSQPEKLAKSESVKVSKSPSKTVKPVKEKYHPESYYKRQAEKKASKCSK